MTVGLLERRARGRPAFLTPMVLAELTDHCNTAQAIAARIGCNRERVLDALYRLENARKVRRAGTQERVVRGRPHLRWRRVEAMA